jgi:hypothetical protein
LDLLQRLAVDEAEHDWYFAGEVPVEVGRGVQAVGGPSLG